MRRRARGEREKSSLRSNKGPGLKVLGFVTKRNATSLYFHHIFIFVFFSVCLIEII